VSIFYVNKRASYSIKDAMERINGTVYQVVINNPTEEDRELVKTVPCYVKSFQYQDEVGKEGTLHINGAVKCKYTTNIAKIKKWLPRAHISVAKSKKHAENILTYAHKDDTHIEGTRCSVEGQLSYGASDICIMLAREVLDVTTTYDTNYKMLYDKAVCRLLLKDRQKCGAVMNPSLRNFWIRTYKVWALYAREINIEPSITNAPPPSTEDHPPTPEDDEGAVSRSEA